MPNLSLSDLFARYRGGESWPQTKATVWSRELIENPRGGSVTAIEFTYWVDGEIQVGKFNVTNPATNLNKDDTFEVHYDPRHPLRHFFAPAAEGSALVLKIWAVMAIALAGLVLIVLKFHR